MYERRLPKRLLGKLNSIIEWEDETCSDQETDGKNNSVSLGTGLLWKKTIILSFDAVKSAIT